MKQRTPAPLLTVVLALVGGLVFIGFPAVPRAAEVPLRTIKKEFFTSLNQGKRLALLEALDRGQQLTAQELGAKYRWGQVPPDRQPPFFLARWWKSLSAAERQRQRLNWFRNNYQQLDLDRAARELNEQDRLTGLYRRLKREHEEPARRFETMFFPGRDLTFRDTGEDTRVGGVFRMESGADSPPETPEPPVETNQTETPTGDESPPAEPSETPARTEPEPVTPVEPPEESDTGWTRVRHFGDRTIIYRREGDEITVHRRTRDGETIRQSTYPLPEPSERSRSPRRKRTPGTTAEPVPVLRFPPPDIRRSEPRRPRLELPPVRR